MIFEGVFKVKSSEPVKVNSGVRVKLIGTMFDKKMQASGTVTLSAFYVNNDKVRSTPHTFVPGDFYYLNGKLTTLFFEDTDNPGDIKSYTAYNVNVSKGAILKLDKVYMEEVASYEGLKERYSNAKLGKKHSEESESDFE